MRKNYKGGKGHMRAMNGEQSVEVEEQKIDIWKVILR